MKSWFRFMFLLCLACLVFSGCEDPGDDDGAIFYRITSESPGTANTIYMRPGDVQVFQVDGNFPVEDTDEGRSYWLKRFETETYSYYADPMWGLGKTYTYEATDQENANKFELSFHLEQYNWGVACLPIPPFFCFPSDGWDEVDSSAWKIQIIPNGGEDWVWAGSYVVENNADLQMLKGCKEIGGKLIIHDYKADIMDLSALESLTKVGLDLFIDGTVNLKNFKGLEKLKSVGALRIWSNASLENLNGLENLESVTEFYLYSNPVLASMEGLDNLKAISDNFRISENASLVDLSGLKNLQPLENGETGPKDLWVSNNASLKSLAGLQRLTHLHEVHIDSNPELLDLDGLAGIDYVENKLYVTGNAKLENIKGLGNLSRVRLGLSISENPSLIDLQGLEKITIMEEQLYIGNNSSLVSLRGLENLTQGIYVTVWGNESLESMSALQNLTSIRSNLSIMLNTVLTDVDMPLLVKVGNSLVISDNPNLCTSKAEALQEQVQKETATIDGNKDC